MSTVAMFPQFHTCLASLYRMWDGLETEQPWMWAMPCRWRQGQAMTGRLPRNTCWGGTVVNVQCLSRVAVMLTSTHVVDTVHSAVLHLIMEWDLTNVDFPRQAKRPRVVAMLVDHHTGAPWMHTLQAQWYNDLKFVFPYWVFEKMACCYDDEKCLPL